MSKKRIIDLYKATSSLILLALERDLLEKEPKDMIQITFPDGAVRSYESGVSAMDIAKSISEGLARKVLAAKVNDQVWDATRPITQDSTLQLLTWDDTDGKSTFWHSSAHLLAEAVEALY